MAKKSGSGSGIKNPDHISESLEIIFWAKILKFFDADPDQGSLTEKILIRESGIWDGKNVEPGSGDRDGKNSDSGSSFWDKHPRSAKLEILSPNLLGLKEPNNNQTLCGKGILG
jgi:hypothetical protein